MQDTPKLQYDKAEIYAKVRELIAQKLPSEEVKNPHLAQQLKNIREDDVLILPGKGTFVAGYLRINCTAEGFHRYADDSYVRRTMNDEVDSAEWLFCLAGDAGLGETAQKLTGISYTEEAQERIAKAVAKNYCGTQLSNLNMSMKDCRVNNYRFIRTKPEFELYGWDIKIAYRDEKGNARQLFCGTVRPEDLQCEKQKLNLWLSLPLCIAKKREERSRTAANIIYNLLFFLSLTAFAVNAFIIRQAGSLLHIGVIAAGIALFVCAKLTRGGIKKFFTVLSLFAVAVMIADVFIDFESFLK